MNDASRYARQCVRGITGVGITGAGIAGVGITGVALQAAGKGIGRPAFRVIQNHFATHGNVGDVAAREEIWEVIAQLVGLAASVALLQALDSATSSGSDAGVTVIGTWALVQAAHLALRCATPPQRAVLCLPCMR